MTFASTDDLQHLVILSDRNTHKFANLAANRWVALLVDDRGNKTTDTQESIAVTSLGRAFEADVPTCWGTQLIGNLVLNKN
jgi:hypothetical protein